MGSVSHVLLDHPLPSSGYPDRGPIELPGAPRWHIPARVGFDG